MKKNPMTDWLINRWKTVVGILWMAVFMLAVSSCRSDHTPGWDAGPYDSDALTVLAYMVADNNLEADLLNNVKDMYAGLAAMDRRAALVVYWDGEAITAPDGSDHLLLKFETDGKGRVNGHDALDTDVPLSDIIRTAEVVKTYPEQLSTDAGVMTGIVRDMVAASPTSRMGLVLGSHGSAWLGSISVSGRAFGQDGWNTDNTMSIPQLCQALGDTGHTFDFLLYDACYMGTAEVYYEMRGVADYQIGSVMEVPGYGFPYNRMLRYLYAGTPDSYRQACEEYLAFYRKRLDESPSSSSWGTLTLVDSHQMEALAHQVAGQLDAAKEIFPTINLNEIQEYGRDKGRYISFDMMPFVRELNRGSLPSSFDVQLRQTVVYTGCIEDADMNGHEVDLENYSGMGMYIPITTRPVWNQWFRTLQWYTAAGWQDLLDI